VGEGVVGVGEGVGERVGEGVGEGGDGVGLGEGEGVGTPVAGGPYTTKAFNSGFSWSFTKPMSSAPSLTVALNVSTNAAFGPTMDTRSSPLRTVVP